jgi:hypothetical protein
MKGIKNILIFHQREKGGVITPEEAKKEENIANLLGTQPKKEDMLNDKSSENGYWVTLQDWSQCSKKCDGGVRTFIGYVCLPKMEGSPVRGRPSLPSLVIRSPVLN